METNQKQFFSVMKNMRNKKNHIFQEVKNKEGKILSDKKLILERWKQHFQKLLTSANFKREEVQKKLTPLSEETEEIEIKMEEVEEVVKNLKLWIRQR
ncbi:hypothetical protein ILUMI_25146 [Ignelater luminosus]|uniref:Uncharacterized protein n=1 Tax=Ignelater luminosus TaxID=2038154 RepID=A0A8K0CAI5_IGNLU|nr:hypothetical protein ILUMI_25146 [Ignelater luminosus]